MSKADLEAACDSPQDLVVMCRWWQPHQYGKWTDFEERETARNHPILIQERRCVKCNHARRREVSIFN